MNTLHQWLEVKKKRENPADNIDFRNTHYNQALTDLQDSLSTLLSAMEAEIRERIGVHEDNPHIENTLVTGINHDNSLVKHGANSERTRIHTIIHEYFRTQI